MDAHPPQCVLVIEDDESLSDLLSVALRMRGYQVRTAGDGLAGLRLLEAYEPDVVVLDLGLPIANGFDVVTELRAVTKTRMTPVIAISGLEEPLRAARQSADFVATLAKPFEPDALVALVERALRVYRV